MTHFRISNAAVADLMDIGRYTEANWGIEKRNNILLRFEETFSLLTAQPYIGRSIAEIRSGYRKYPEGKHIIFYRLAEDGCIEIIRILHQQMDSSQHL